MDSLTAMLSASREGFGPKSRWFLGNTVSPANSIFDILFIVQHARIEDDLRAQSSCLAV